MSFNVRYGTAEDGDHIWDQRPAVFGVQEALDFQLAYIKEHCPDYEWVGVARKKKDKELIYFHIRQDDLCS